MSTYSSLDPRTNAWAVSKLLINAQPYMHIMNMGDSEPLPENKTDTVIFRRYLPLAISTTPLTEGTKTENNVNIDFEDFSVTLNQYGAFTNLTDKVLLMHEDPVLSQAIERLGEQAGKTIETIGWNVLSAVTSVKLSGGAGSAAAVAVPFTINDIRESVRFLENNDAPKMTKMVAPTPGFNTVGVAESYYCLIHPDLKKDLRKLNDSAGGKLNDFFPIEQYSSAMSSIPGEVGYVEDVRFVQSTLYKSLPGAGATITGTPAVKTTTVGSDKKADLYNMVFLAKNAFSTVALKGAFAAKIQVSFDGATIADPYNNNRTISWKVWYAVVVTNPRNIVRLVTASTV